MPIFTKENILAQKKFGTYGKPYLKTLNKKYSKSLHVDQIKFIKKQKYFFIASANKSNNNMHISVKGMERALIKLNKQTFKIKNWMGDGIFNTLGNIMTNPRVAIIFFDFESKRRLRIQAKVKIIMIKRKNKFSKYCHDSYLNFTFLKVFENCRRY